MELAGWRAGAAQAVTEHILGSRDQEDLLGSRDQEDVPGTRHEAVERLLRFAAEELIPRLAATAGEIDAVLHALDGGHVPAGPSGSPLRGLINTLPTGRNFYAVDPKAVPSRLAWDTGQQLADSLLARYREDTGEWPSTVGLSVWGTAAMRTSGDDIAEVLALLGVRPVWDDASRRVTTSPRCWRCSGYARCGTTRAAGSPAWMSFPRASWGGRGSTWSGGDSTLGGL